MRLLFSRGPFRTCVAPSLQGEQGLVLPLILMILVILSVLVSTILSIGVSEPQMVANLRWATQALNAADAGVEAAFANMRAANVTVNGFNGYLGTNAPLFDNVPFGEVAYTVSVVNNIDADPSTPAVDNDDTVIINSTGTARGGANRIIRAVVTGRYGFDNAVVTNGDLAITGDSCVAGKLGNVHANGDLTVGGSTPAGQTFKVAHNATATGRFTLEGSATVGGIGGGNQPPVRIPDIQPSAFRPLATMVLRADGTATDGVGNSIPVPPGWIFDPRRDGQWTCCNGRDGTNGIVYAETDIVISSNPNAPSDPWRATLITTGSLDISGSPSIAPAIDPSTGRPLDIQFIAGTDILAAGFPSDCTNCLAGLIYAREQFDVRGNVPLRGLVMALGAGDTSRLVRANQNVLSGDMCVTLNTPPRVRAANGPLRIISWSTLAR